MCEILLLDEVTSSLDKEITSLVESYIKELNNNGVTVLWITHNDEQSKSIFNKRIVISEGRISKEEEVLFQIMVTFMLLSSASIATLISTYQAYKSFYNERSQLVC